MTESLTTQLSSAIEKVSNHFRQLSKPHSEPLLEQSPKLAPNSPETSQTSSKLPTDGRSKPRSQKQVDTYKRNFARRHTLVNAPDQTSPSVKSKTIYDQIFSPF